MSGPHEVRVAGPTTRSLPVDADGVLDVAGSDPAVDPPGTVTATVTVRNPDDDPARNVTVRIADVSPGWSVTDLSASDGGVVDADARTVTWARVPAGGEVTASLTVRAPEGADHMGRVGLAGTSDTNFVSATDPVRVRLAGRETTTHLGGEGGTNATPDETRTPTLTTDPPARTETDGGSLPGFTAVMALAALLVAVALVRR